MKRKRFLSQCNVPFLFMVLALLAYRTAVAQHKPNKNQYDVLTGKWLHFSDAPNSLYQHLSAQSYEYLTERSGKIATLTTLADWKEWQRFVRETLLDIMGPFPEKTPLNAKIVKVIEKDGYKVEHIVYESRPKFYVTSSLFIPDGLKRGAKAPVVIYCSGHSATGYRSETYQHVILNLVKKGFIVFAFDPVGQGERLEYNDPKTGKSIALLTEEHSYSGAQAFITGASQASYMIWDGIRAVDYLLTRKEIDSERIGMTGRSGGGTQSAYIAAIDPRIYAVAPENYLTTFTRLLQTKGPQDAEQNLFNVVQRGIDQPDFLLARAPKPALMITTSRDIFSIQGSKESTKEVSRIYQAYDKPENFSMVTDDTVHASTKKNREAMYAFFQKHLNNPGSVNDEEVTLLSDEEIQVTKTGQVSTALNSETVFSLNQTIGGQLEAKLQSSRNNLGAHLPKVLDAAKKLSGYKEPVEEQEPVLTGRFQKPDYVVEQYFIKGEGAYVVPYLLMKPAHPNRKALLYLHPSGKSAEAFPGEEMEWFVKKGFTVLAPDMLGTGEIGQGSAQSPRTYLLNWFASTLIARSIVGVQAGDVVKLLEVLKEDHGTDEVYGLAHKEMTSVLLHAAAFNKEITRIALIEPLSSYRSIVMNRFYQPRFIHSFVPGALKAYDLPDLAASLAPRKLMVVGMIDGAGNSNFSEVETDQLVIRTAYNEGKAEDNLVIIPQQSAETLPDYYEAWIK